jgi:hypothetical protein
MLVRFLGRVIPDRATHSRSARLFARDERSGARGWRAGDLGREFGTVVSAQWVYSGCVCCVRWCPHKALLSSCIYVAFSVVSDHLANIRSIVFVTHARHGSAFQLRSSLDPECRVPDRTRPDRTRSDMRSRTARVHGYTRRADLRP